MSVQVQENHTLVLSSAEPLKAIKQCSDTWFVTPRASAEESNTLEKHSELSFIALHQKMITRNSFTELLKSILTLWVLEETKQTSTIYSELKALVDSGKFRVIVFQYRAKNNNSEFSLPSMIPYVTVKFRVTVFMYIGPKTITGNSEFT